MANNENNWGGVLVQVFRDVRNWWNQEQWKKVKMTKK